MKHQDNYLYTRKPNGRYQLAEPDHVVETAQEIVASYYNRCPETKITDPNSARAHLNLRMNKEHEIFVAVFLDSKHRILGIDELFRGTIDNASVPVREVVKDALKYNAAALIVAHNHPSGDCSPSASDNTLTEALTLGLQIVGVKLLDHFIFGDGGADGAFSFAEAGKLI